MSTQPPPEGVSQGGQNVTPVAFQTALVLRALAEIIEVEDPLLCLCPLRETSNRNILNALTSQLNTRFLMGNFERINIRDVIGSFGPRNCRDRVARRFPKQAPVPGQAGVRYDEMRNAPAIPPQYQADRSDPCGRSAPDENSMTGGRGKCPMRMTQNTQAITPEANVHQEVDSHGSSQKLAEWTEEDPNTPRAKPAAPACATSGPISTVQRGQTHQEFMHDLGHAQKVWFENLIFQSRVPGRTAIQGVELAAWETLKMYPQHKIADLMNICSHARDQGVCVDFQALTKKYGDGKFDLTRENVEIVKESLRKFPPVVRFSCMRHVFEHPSVASSSKSKDPCWQGRVEHASASPIYKSMNPPSVSQVTQEFHPQTDEQPEEKTDHVYETSKSSTSTHKALSPPPGYPTPVPVEKRPQAALKQPEPGPLVFHPILPGSFHNGVFHRSSMAEPPTQAQGQAQAQQKAFNVIPTTREKSRQQAARMEETEAKWKQRAIEMKQQAVEIRKAAAAKLHREDVEMVNTAEQDLKVLREDSAKIKKAFDSEYKALCERAKAAEVNDRAHVQQKAEVAEQLSRKRAAQQSQKKEEPQATIAEQPRQSVHPEPRRPIAVRPTLSADNGSGTDNSRLAGLRADLQKARDLYSAQVRKLQDPNYYLYVSIEEQNAQTKRSEQTKARVFALERAHGEAQAEADEEAIVRKQCGKEDSRWEQKSEHEKRPRTAVYWQGRRLDRPPYSEDPEAGMARNKARIGSVTKVGADTGARSDQAQTRNTDGAAPADSPYKAQMRDYKTAVQMFEAGQKKQREAARAKAQREATIQLEAAIQAKTEADRKEREAKAKAEADAITVDLAAFVPELKARKKTKEEAEEARLKSQKAVEANIRGSFEEAEADQQAKKQQEGIARQKYDMNPIAVNHMAWLKAKAMYHAKAKEKADREAEVKAEREVSNKAQEAALIKGQEQAKAAREIAAELREKEAADKASLVHMIKTEGDAVNDSGLTADKSASAGGVSIPRVTIDKEPQTVNQRQAGDKTKEAPVAEPAATATDKSKLSKHIPLTDAMESLEAEVLRLDMDENIAKQENARKAEKEEAEKEAEGQREQTKEDKEAKQMKIAVGGTKPHRERRSLRANIVQTAPVSKAAETKTTDEAQKKAPVIQEPVPQKPADIQGGPLEMIIEEVNDSQPVSTQKQTPSTASTPTPVLSTQDKANKVPSTQEKEDKLDSEDWEVLDKPEEQPRAAKTSFREPDGLGRQARSGNFFSKFAYQK